MEKERIGIQFNPIDEKIITVGSAFKAMGVEVTTDHVDLFFSRKELKKFNIKKDSEKMKVALSLLRKHLENSSYTNIYTYLDANKLSSIEGSLKYKRMRTSEIGDDQSFINNFKDKISQQSVINLVKKSHKMKFIDKLLSELVQRDFGLDQKMTLELGFEDKEEWGADEDNIVVSIQFDIPTS